MNFQSILIITCGRSGSTLLQGILNSHEEVLVRGENYNFCFHLFQGYAALKKTKKEIPQLLPKEPFFGNSNIDEDFYIARSAETVKRILLSDQIKNDKIKAFGFKEIRYEGVLDYLPEYLEFLKLIFPNPVFVFNTRNKEAVVKSRLSVRWIKEKDFQRSMDSLTRVESIFAEYIKNNPTNSFHITYEEVITKSDKLQKLHSFIGLPYFKSEMDNVLGEVHSYAPLQMEIRKKKDDKPNKDYQMFSENPLVTVLLCTFNDETYIEESIQSILDQTYKNFEFIILNDGSTDNTKQIIQSFDDPRIRYLEHEKNKGLEDSKNWGIEEARGKYIAYIDGDDLALSDRLSTQTKYMEQNPDVGLCASAVAVFGTKNNYYHSAETDLEIRCRTLVGTPLTHPSCMIRTSVLKEHNIRYNKNFPAAEDHPFMLELLKVTKAYCFPKVLLRYRWHEQNVSITNRTIQKESAERARDLAFKELVGIEITEKEKEVFVDFWRDRCEPTQIKILEGLRDKIYIDANLNVKDSEFRYYLKNRIQNTLSELYRTLRGYHQLLKNKEEEISELKKDKESLRVSLHSANYELRSMFQSISWKLTSPLRWIGIKLFRLKSGK